MLKLLLQGFCKPLKKARVMRTNTTTVPYDVGTAKIYTELRQASQYSRYAFIYGLR